MCKYDIEAYYKVTYDVMATLYCYYYPSMQFFMLCKCVLSRKKFVTIPHLCLWFSCTLRTCLPSGLGPLKILLQRSHLETMSGSNEYDKLEK